MRVELPSTETVSLAGAVAADGSLSGWRIRSASGDLDLDLSIERTKQFRAMGEFELIWLTSAELAALARSPIEGSRGLGAAVAPLLAELSRNGSSTDFERPVIRLALIVRGLLSAIAAERAEADPCGRLLSAQQRLVVLAMQVIHERLTDPELTSRSIAAVVGVSIRSLQSAFHDSRLSIVGVIRALRLERARVDIEGIPAGGSISPTSMGLRLGFRDRAAFARAFAGRYGVLPSEALAAAERAK